MPKTNAQKLNEEARNIKRGQKPWTEALHLELFSGDPDRKQLRKIAKNVIKAAAEGDDKAIKELSERLDGKIVNQIKQDGEVTITVNR